jgi:hypothetical protein
MSAPSNFYPSMPYNAARISQRGVLHDPPPHIRGPRSAKGPIDRHTIAAVPWDTTATLRCRSFNQSLRHCSCNYLVGYIQLQGLEGRCGGYCSCRNGVEDLTTTRRGDFADYSARQRSFATPRRSPSVKAMEDPKPHIELSLMSETHRRHFVPHTIISRAHLLCTDRGATCHFAVMRGGLLERGLTVLSGCHLRHFNVLLMPAGAPTTATPNAI